MYVHKVPLIDTRCSHSVQPAPRFFPSCKGDEATYDFDQTMHWYHSKQYEDDCPMEESLGSDDDGGMEMDSDDDTPLTPQFTSTPNTEARPATNRSNRRSHTSFTLPSTSSSSSRSRNTSTGRQSTTRSGSSTLPDPQPSTSSSSSRSRNASGRSGSNNRSMAALPSYQRDLGALVPIGLDVGVPKMDNFNGRSCHFIASLRAAMYVMKINHVNVPRPNPSQDIFTRLFVEIFWNYGSSALTVNPEPILDAFVELFMARDVQLHVDIPTMYQHPKDR